MNIVISNNYLSVREMSRETCKTRVFIKSNKFDKPVHISFLFKDHLYGILFTKEFVEYSIPRESLPGNFELYEVADCETVYIMEYRVSNNEVLNLGMVDRAMDLSSGFKHIDSLIKEISSYRNEWIRELCEKIEDAWLYRYFLKADTVLRYVLTRRLKDAWLELSNEYNAFIYSLVHAALNKHGFKLRNPLVIWEKCQQALKTSNLSWKNIFTQYSDGAEKVSVYIEKMIHGVSPDIYISSSQRSMIIECKQGPTKTWLLKATKQSSRYREIADIVSLITTRQLSREETLDLLNHYDQVIDQCNLANKSTCFDKVQELVSRLTSKF